MGLAARICALVAAGGLALAACGSDERSFTAEEFIDEANAHGAGLELGAPLETTQADAELYQVTAEGGEEAAPELEHAHGGGSMKLTADAEAAEAEHARCESAVSLFCYRAANVVLIFEQDSEPEALAQVAEAIKAMQGD